jgi:type I restriction enzyme M protein
MSIAHQIEKKNCTIYSEDISQKSSNMLRLNFGLTLRIRSQISSKPTLVCCLPYLDTKFDNALIRHLIDFSDFHANLDKASPLKKKILLNS